MISYLKSIWQWLVGAPASATAPPALSSAEQAAITRAVMQPLLERYGVAAVYCSSFVDEGDAQAAARSLPLFYVWGQTEGEAGTEFRFGTNGLMISALLMQHLPPGSTRFRLMRSKIQRILHKVAYEALVTECQALELTPRELLAEWSAPP